MVRSGNSGSARSRTPLERVASTVAVVAIAAFATSAAASVFYAFNVVAESGVGAFFSFGNGPSVNDKGKVAFVARYSATANSNEK